MSAFTGKPPVSAGSPPLVKRRAFGKQFQVPGDRLGEAQGEKADAAPVENQMPPMPKAKTPIGLRRKAKPLLNA